MDLHELKNLGVSIDDGDTRIGISYDTLEREFTDTDHNMVLYSNIDFVTKDFEWHATVPTVKIPYKDPAMGFLLEGVVFSSVGIYQRAPGVVLGKDPDGVTGVDDIVDIVTSRNSTINISYKRNGVQIGFRKGGHERHVPIGIFLKAFSSLPYDLILKRFAFKPPLLLNSFPCEVPQRGVDLAKVASFGIDRNEEPDVESCIDYVYAALMQTDARSKGTHYSAHWKSNRIRTYFNGLHFKTESNYESTLALHARAIGSKLDQHLSLQVFNEDGTVSDVSYVKGTFINDDIADFLKWHDVPVLRVRGAERSYLLQEDTPMLFRAVGYKVTADIPEIGMRSGEIITKDRLKEINGTAIKLLEVQTPSGRKVLTRSSMDPDVGDFFTILNCMFTASFTEHDESSQYEIANRVVIDYNKQVLLEVEQTYADIANALAGCQQLKNIIESMPRLPSTRLHAHLRDSNTKELSQAEVTNIMSRAVAERRASALMKSAPAAMTAVQKGQYSRIDSLHSPESDKVGAVQEITAMAKLNTETGELMAPYERVVDGKPTGSVEYISAAKESNKYIVAWDCKLDTDTVLARYNDEVTTIERQRVDYRDVSPFCDMSVSRMTIPFPEFSQPRRSLMATKMSGQAVPLLFPERPIVSTGADTEIPCLYYTAAQIVESSLGAGFAGNGGELEVVSVNWTKNSAVYTCVYGGTSFKFSVPYMATDAKSLYCYNLNYREGNKYGMEDIVFYNQSCDMKQYNYFERIEQGTLPLIKNFGKPAMALGVNLTVMFKTYRSSTVDDAVVISDRLISTRKLSSVQIMKYDYKLKSGESYSIYDGVPKLHSQVYAHQPIIGIMKRAKLNEARCEKYVRAKQSGEVIFAEITEATGDAEVWVATFHDAAPGDKVAGRYGNKSVIAKIIPHYEMPYDPATGETADIVLSPLGLPSRMNYGQLIEVTMGAVMRKEGKCAVVTPFYPGIKAEVEELYSSSGLTKKCLYNPVYGKFTERPVMMGTMYFLKLEQMANLKDKAVGYPVAVDPVFSQPVDSINVSKGQRVGEMETWALGAAGATIALNSMFTMYASDENSRNRYFEMLQANRDDGTPGSWDESMTDILSYRKDNRDALSTQTVVRMFGLDLDVDDVQNVYRFVPLNLEDIPIVASLLELKNHSEPTAENEWCKVKLQAPVVNPFWINNFPLNVILGVQSVKTLAAGTYYLNVYDRSVRPERDLTDFSKAAMITGIDAVIALLRNTTIDQAIDRLTSSAQTVQSTNSDTVEAIQLDTPVVTIMDDEGNVVDDFLDVPASVADIVRFLRRMQSLGLELKDLIWEYMPVMPKVFRQTNVIGGIEREQSFHKQLRHICEAGRSEDIYKMLEQFIGYGENKSDNLESLRGYFFGKGSESGDHGNIRKRVLSKRVGFTGRSVIIPSADIEMAPFFVGIPWKLAMIELSRVLAIRLGKRASEMSNTLIGDIGEAGNLNGLKSDEWEEIIVSLGEFSYYVFDKYFPALSYSDKLYLYNYLRTMVRRICESAVSPDGRVLINGTWYNAEEAPRDVTIDAAVVDIGRQPTLHKWSIRTFFMKLVDGDSLQIHPTVCGGFNADFDGDTMWHAQLFGEAKNEGWQTMSCLQDLISEKDGSYMLNLVQDTALGLYCATIFKNNSFVFEGKSGDYHFFDNPKNLRLELEYGTLNYYDVVLYLDRQKTGCMYISTAGRVLLNTLVPNALTKIPFTDKWGICKAVLGEEAIPAFCEMRYDMVWVATGTKPKDGPETVKIENILLDIYHSEGARASVLLTQALYEVGLVASDIYSVTASMEDMSIDVDVSVYMEDPKEQVKKYNSLEQMGLITERERKEASIRAWNRAYKQATDAVLTAIPQNSNTHFLLYSGARGKIGQIMQSVGFVGTISKTTTTDIEYPILRSYGSGLSPMDLFQARYMARIGVVSTQAGTKDTGYSTRQTVYMSSGMCVKEDDCGIETRQVPVEYSSENVQVKLPSGDIVAVDSLIGQSVDPSSSELYALREVRNALNRSGYLITEEILGMFVDAKWERIDLFEGPAQFIYTLDEDWREEMLEGGYSYSLPYTINRKITEESLEWVEQHGLKNIIAFSKEESESEQCFDCEAYLPVDYDHSKYTLYSNGVRIDEERIYGRSVSADTEGFHYFNRLLGTDNAMTVRALQYLLKKGVRRIQLENGMVVDVRYQISKLFRELVLNRFSVSLPYLSDEVITDRTLAEVENVQLEFIPVWTSLTCLCEGGICARCNGLMRSSGQMAAVGTNLGIAAAQAQCEPLSQSTLNVTHSGGKRSEGVGQLMGLPYYMKMLQGKLVSDKTRHLLEGFASVSGYIKVNAHDNHFFQIVSEEGEVLDSYELDDPSRLNVIDGAYVDKGDTVRTGRPVLDRYSSSNIFKSALETRYLLLREYYGIFKDLNVSPRNYEILAREQTSMCYLEVGGNLPPVQDTSVEAKSPTGKYVLYVSKQFEVVNKFSGVAGFAFENVASMLTSGVLNSGGLSLNSILGNLVTGTPVGSETVNFIPKKFGTKSLKYRKSAVKSADEQVKQIGDGRLAWNLALGTAEPQQLGGITEQADNLLDALLNAEAAIDDGGVNRLSLSSGLDDDIMPEPVVNVPAVAPLQLESASDGVMEFPDFEVTPEQTCPIIEFVDADYVTVEETPSINPGIEIVVEDVDGETDSDDSSDHGPGVNRLSLD